MRNPFTPMFGAVPPFMAGRESLVEEFSEAFDNGYGDPNLSSVISGARGTGKTALLTLLAEEAQAYGWITVNTTASSGMLEDILDLATFAAQEFVQTSGRKLTGVSIGQIVGVEWSNEQPRPSNWRSQMNQLLDQLAEHDVGLLITVDEVRGNLDEMKQLVIVYQHFVRERRKVALLMAGLPYKVSRLLAEEDISFLRRARRHKLGRISDMEIRDALLRTVEESGRSISPAALNAAVEAIDGFPYMMQLVGYRMWAQHPRERTIKLEDATRGIEEARREMEESIVESTYRDLSAGDVRFLEAMLADEGDSCVSDIAVRLGVARNYASQYKRRLLEQGIISEAGRNYVRFDMPTLKSYVRKKSEERFDRDRKSARR